VGTSASSDLLICAPSHLTTVELPAFVPRGMNLISPSMRCTPQGPTWEERILRLGAGLCATDFRLTKREHDGDGAVPQFALLRKGETENDICQTKKP
jgi:hypothetical protein